jgi:3-methyl-2-oxobutanoate hydroxymethyltransferase
MGNITIQDLLKKKAEKKKITMLTAYDYPFAKMVDEAGIDAIIVGDSVGMVVQGLDMLPWRR